MRALRLHVTPSGFVRARTLGRFTESAIFGPLSNLRLAEVPEPGIPTPGSLAEGWVGLDVMGCGICGTDLGTLSYHASPVLEPFGSFPAVLGHEILARVRETGPGVTGLEPGMRVAVDPFLSCQVRGHPEADHCPSCRAGRHATCEEAGEEGVVALEAGRLSPGLTMGYHRDLPGGFGERMVAHHSQVFPVPDALDDRTAVLTEPLSIGVHAVLNAGPGGGRIQDLESDVLVIGSGPIAMGVVWALRATGFRGSITAQTKRAHEAEMARRLGATNVVKPGLEAREALIATGSQAYQPILGDEVFSGGGFPLVFDCVGNAGSLTQALRWTAPRGTLVMLGCAAEIPKLDLTFVWARELNVRGFVGHAWETWEGERRHSFQITHDLLVATGAPVRELVTHTFPLARYREAFSVASNHRRSGALKVVLEPG
jgi:threonine dehydrogenase-like Zn-dependent dehydrogenase